MTDETPTPMASKGQLFVGCLLVSVFLFALAATATVGAGMAVWAYWQWVQPDPPPYNPIDPADVDEDLATAAESAGPAVQGEIVRCRREIKKSRNQHQRLRELLPNRIHDAGFSEIDAILERTHDGEFPKVFNSLSAGFLRASQTLQYQDRAVAEFFTSLSRNFAGAAKSARQGVQEEKFHWTLLDSNHAARERLIDAVVGETAGDEEPDDDWTFSGYLIDNEHREELKATATPLPMMAFRAPPEMDPRGWHRIENQGAMGSCQGHAQSSVCELAARIAFREAAAQGDVAKVKSLGQMFERALSLRRDDIIQFSPMYAYITSQKFDNIAGTDCGSTLAGGLRAAKEKGSCPLEIFPYPNPVRYSTAIPSGADAAADGFKIRRHVVCRNYGEVFNFLASGQGGVEIGIRWPNEYMRCNGIIEHYSPGNSGGGHAICFLGYSKRKDSQGRNYLWMANSWSPDWGNKGWAEVSPQAVDQMCQYPDTVMIGLSDMKAARPRDVSWIGKGSVF